MNVNLKTKAAQELDKLVEKNQQHHDFISHVISKSRIHPTCNSRGVKKHDSMVGRVGVCRICGKQMTIEKLRKLYKE